MTMPAAIALSLRRASGIAAPRRRSIVDYPEECAALFCLAFRSDNAIHLFPPTSEVAMLLKEAVSAVWKLESDDIDEQCYTLLLEGTPFLMYGRRENALLVKQLCCQILSAMKNFGCELLVCTDLSPKTDLTLWYFGRMEPVRPPSPPPKSLSPDEFGGPPTLVCLSLSTKRNLQLINAPDVLKQLLRATVEANFPPGVDQDSNYGNDYEIRLNGKPWDTDDRREIVAACKLIVAIFYQFSSHGYHLYGLANLKETADSLFFEFDPSQTSDEDQYMIMSIDEENILRLIGASEDVVEVVKRTIQAHWDGGFAAEGRIDFGDDQPSRQSTTGGLSWEFVLDGSPWLAKSSKLGRSRQLITCMLDGLLTHGWTVVTGLDISRSSNKKSALLFQRCPPVRGLRHACLSPLGKKSFQLLNAPVSLKHLVRCHFQDMLERERESEDGDQYEISFTGNAWWGADTCEPQFKKYISVRRRMGDLLQTLFDAGWRVIASADVARQADDEQQDVGQGVHSWFLIFCGNDDDDSVPLCLKVTANQVLRVGARIGTPRALSPASRPRRSPLGAVRSASLMFTQAGDGHRQVAARRAFSPPPSGRTAGGGGGGGAGGGGGVKRSASARVPSKKSHQ